MKKVAFIIDVWDDPSSGAVVTAHRFVNKLKKYYDIHIISTSLKKNKNNKDINITKHTINGYYFPGTKKQMKNNGMKFGKINKKTIDKLTDVISKSDLVYVHFPFQLEWEAIKIAKQYNKPIISGFHVQPENIFHNNIIRFFAEKLVYRLFIKKMFNKSDVIIAPSLMAKNILLSKSYFNKNINIEIISNGLNDKYKPNFSNKNKSDKLKILSVGRFSPEKNQKMIIQAISLSKYKNNIILKLNGKGPLKQTLYNYAKKNNININIGFVSEEQLIYDYQHNDLFIHSSSVELEGMSVLEAIGCGCPALISNVKTSASNQFAIDNRFLFSDIKSLVNKINYFYENKHLLKDISKEYVNISEKYRFKESVKKMIKIFDNIY